MEMRQQHNGKRVVFSQSHFQKIGHFLQEFLKRSRATVCIFADMNGYPIAYQGNIDRSHASTLAALAAGDFSATAEIARIIGEKQTFSFIYHEGHERNLYLSKIGTDFIMIVLFDKRIALGMVRILTKNTTEKLNILLTDIKKQSEQASSFLNMEFRTLLDKELDKTFGLKRS